MRRSIPPRPLRLVVPYAAGGSTDVLARMAGQKLTILLGQPVIIDHRTGAGTLIATEIVARAAPDGYTLLMATPPLAVAPALYDKLPFDVERDFAAITNIAATSNVLVIHPSVPAQTVKELVALGENAVRANIRSARAVSAAQAISRPSSFAAWRASISCTCRTKAVRSR